MAISTVGTATADCPGASPAECLLPPARQPCLGLTRCPRGVVVRPFKVKSTGEGTLHLLAALIRVCVCGVCAMDKSSPPLVPGQADVDVYLVLDNFGRLGRAYRETDEAEADRQTIIGNLITGHYHCPERVVTFNTVENFARDVSEDIARAVAAHVRYGGKLSPGTLHFLAVHLDEDDIPATAHG